MQPFFSAKVNKHFVSFRGTAKPFADSIETNFDVNVKDLKDKKPQEAAEAEKKKEDVQMPVIEADELIVAAGKVTFADLAENRNFRTAFEQIQVKVNNFSTVKDKKTNVEAEFFASEKIRRKRRFSEGPRDFR